MFRLWEKRLEEKAAGSCQNFYVFKSEQKLG